MKRNIILAKRYLSYLFSAGNAHSIHSPFVFDLYTQVIRGKTNSIEKNILQQLRIKMLNDNRVLNVTDYGTAEGESSQRKLNVSYIAKHYSSGEKKTALLFRLSKYFKPKNILELGTSLGFGTTALALGSPQSKIISLEGCPQTAGVAEENFNSNGIKDIEISTGEFSKTLSYAMEKISSADLVFIDGNHRSSPTLFYFEQFLKKSNENSLFIFDDIHWSADMEKAWTQIQNHSSVSVTIDLFSVGLVFLRGGIEKQNFVLKF